MGRLGSLIGFRYYPLISSCGSRAYRARGLGIIFIVVTVMAEPL